MSASPKMCLFYYFLMSLFFPGCGPTKEMKNWSTSLWSTLGCIRWDTSPIRMLKWRGIHGCRLRQEWTQVVSWNYMWYINVRIDTVTRGAARYFEPHGRNIFRVLHDLTCVINNCVSYLHFFYFPHFTKFVEYVIFTINTAVQ